VVTTKDGDSGRISNFEGDEKCDGFDGVVASINVVACVSSQFRVIMVGLCGNIGIPMKR
jgi:hypothetical protein